jgi:hypothetical protein
LSSKGIRNTIGLRKVVNTHAASGIAIEELADIFMRTGVFELGGLCDEVNGVVFSADERIKRTGISARVDELINQSFSCRFYEWEGRERWFGIQIYRPLVLKETDKITCRIGYWLCSEPGKGIRRRIYSSLSVPRTESKSADDIDDVFKNCFAEHEIVKIRINQDPERVKMGRYVDITANSRSEWTVDRLVSVAHAFMMTHIWRMTTFSE